MLVNGLPEEAVRRACVGPAPSRSVSGGESSVNDTDPKKAGPVAEISFPIVDAPRALTFDEIVWLKQQRRAVKEAHERRVANAKERL